MNLKRILTTSLIVSSTFCFANIAQAGLFSKPVSKQTVLPQHNIQVTEAAYQAGNNLPSPSFTAMKKRPIVMVSHNKNLPQPAPAIKKPTPAFTTTAQKPAPVLTKTAQKPAHYHIANNQSNRVYLLKSKKPPAKRKVSKPEYKTTHITRVAPFNGISANGNIMVTVEPGRFQEVKVMNSGYPGYKLVEPTVLKGMLQLKDVSAKNYKKDAPRFVSVKITTPKITAIRLRDNARLRANKLRTPILDIDAATTGFVNLKGNIGLHHLLQRGTGGINIEWANSDHIKIISHSNGPIHIAGNTDHLTIRANDRAKVDTKHLRSHTGIIQTADNATVSVTIIDALSGFASDMSNIFYYKTPKHLTRHTFGMGNVMQLRYWN